MTNKRFPRTLETAREQCGLTRTELAAKLGLTAAAVGHWEGGNITPSGTSMRMLAITLDIPLPVVKGWFTQERRAAGGAK